MLYGDNHIHVHMVKTGGTWAGRVLFDELGAQRIGHTHDPVSACRLANLRGRKVFGLIRNPWEWYVSLYVHAANTVGIDAMTCYGKGLSDFKSVLRGMTNPAGIPVPEAPGIIGRAGIGRADDFAASGFGLCSWLCRHQYISRGHEVTLIATDRASTELPKFLGLPRSTAKKHPPRNTSRQRWVGRAVECPENKADWYDEESIAWVAEADAALIQMMGFKAFKRTTKASVVGGAA